MKNTKYLSVLCLSLIFWGTGCETIVEVDVPPHEPQLVIYSYARADEFSHELTVGRSAGFLGNDEPEPVSDAEIIITRDGATIGDFIYRNLPEEPYAYLGDFILPSADAGRLFQLTASSPDYPMVTASQVMPPAIAITGLEYIGPGTGGEFGDDETYAYDISFQDPAGEANYYSIQFFKYDSVEARYSRMDLYSVSPIAERGLRRELLTDDETFDGQSVRLRVESEAPPEVFIGGLSLVARLTTVTRDRYLYGKSYRRYRDSDGNPFAEPVTVHSNIEGGFGIFSLEQVNEWVY